MKKIVWILPDKQKRQKELMFLKEEIEREKENKINVFNSPVTEKINRRTTNRQKILANKRNRLRKIKTAKRFKEICRDMDIVHIFAEGPEEMIEKKVYADTARKCGKKCIISFDGKSGVCGWKDAVGEKDYSILLKAFERADKILCPSIRMTKEVNEATRQEKAEYMPKGLLIRDYNYSERGNGIVFLGDIKEKTGAFSLIEAINLLNNINVSPRCIFIGTGEMDRAIQKVKKYGLENVVFEDPYDEEKRKKIMEKTRLLVMPAIEEDFPITVLESMATGHVIIASEEGALPEILGKEAEASNTVLSNDTMGVALAIDKWLSNTDNQKIEMRKNREKLELEYSFENFVEKLKKIYKEE